MEGGNLAWSVMLWAVSTALRSHRWWKAITPSQARATDTFGNVRVSPEATFIVDNTPPQIVVTGGAGWRHVCAGRYPGD